MGGELPYAAPALMTLLHAIPAPPTSGPILKTKCHKDSEEMPAPTIARSAPAQPVGTQAVPGYAKALCNANAHRQSTRSNPDVKQVASNSAPAASQAPPALPAPARGTVLGAVARTETAGAPCAGGFTAAPPTETAIAARPMHDAGEQPEARYCTCRLCKRARAAIYINPGRPGDTARRCTRAGGGVVCMRCGEQHSFE